MKEVEDFEKFQNKLNSKDDLVEPSYIECVPEDWLREKGIIVVYLTEKEEYFISAISGRIIRGEKITECQNRYLTNIIKRCNLLHELDNSPLYEEYRRERQKIMIKRCMGCGVPFSDNKSEHFKFCSNECKDKFNNLLRNKSISNSQIERDGKIKKEDNKRRFQKRKG